MLDNFFFIGLPYIAIVLFVGGTAYRCFSGLMSGYRGNWAWSARGDYLWTTRSSGFFGRASIGPAVLCLHWGIIILLVAHVVGFIGGAYNLVSWVDFFRWVGLFGGVLFFYGVLWAFVRRITISQLRAMSSVEDYIILLFLIAISGLGLYGSAIDLAFGVSYSVGPWFGGILKLRPDVQMMSAIPLINKLHVIFALIFFAYLPFTKLVHMFSYPFSYFTRPYISMRSYVGLKK